MLSFATVNRCLLLLLPAGLWCYIYRGLLFGQQYVSEDTFAIYAVVKYFLSNIQAGVFPHWNPFLHWGMGHICQVGEFNPMWALVFVLAKTGVDVYHAFLWTVVLYMFLGCMGVFCLIRCFIKNDFLAYVGYVFYIFSGFTMTVFTQMTHVLLFVPAVWFFYFFVEFYNFATVRSVLWMTFFIMLILTTYIPFYFLIVFVATSMAGMILFPSVIAGVFKAIMGFIRKRPALFLAACFFVGLAAYASFLNWLMLRKDFLVLARPTDVSYDNIKDSGILIADIMRDSSLFSFLISNLKIHFLDNANSIFTLDAISFDNQRIFYLPLLTHLLIAFGAAAKLTKRIAFWAIVCFFLFLLAITRLSPVYAFVYYHVSFFKMFRNLFFLIPFISFFYILLALDSSKGILEWVITKTGRLSLVIKLLILSAALFPALNVLVSHARKFEAVEQSTLIRQSVSIPLKSPQFSYTRQQTTSEGLLPNDVYRLYNYYMIGMYDTDRFISTHYGYPTQRSNELAQIYDQSKAFQQFIRHKFYLYDQFIPDPVFNEPGDFLNWMASAPAGNPVDEGSELFNVEKFNANVLQLHSNLPVPKYLVYHDSFHPYWKVYINGHAAPLHRSNYAFKGVMIPKGQAVIRFEFEPFGGGFFYFGILALFYVLFGICVYLTLTERGRQYA